MKICLITRYFDSRNAGIGRVSCKLRDGLKSQGHEVIPVSTNGESLLSYFYYSAFQVPGLLPKDADVYHAITPVEGIWLKKRSVVTYLDLIPMTHPERAGAGIGYNQLLNMIGSTYFSECAKKSSKADKIICISEYTKQDVIERLKVPESKIRVIRLGINPDLDYIPQTKTKFVFGYLGQLDRRKRVDLLIREFLKTKVDAELWIAGTGRDEPMLKELAFGDERIKFLGFIPDEKLRWFYNSLSYFIFPTWIEGYGLPIVESLACRTPVIVCDDAIIPNDVKKHCISVQQDLRHIINAAYQGWSSTSYSAYLASDESYRWAKSHDWDKCIKEHIEVYKELRGRE